MGHSFDFTCVVVKDYRTVFENYIAIEAAALGVNCVLVTHDCPLTCKVQIRLDGDTVTSVEKLRSRIQNRSVELWKHKV